MMEKIINILKNNNMFIPRLLLLNYKKLNLSEKELILIIYLLNEKDMLFNPNKISNDLNINLTEVLETIDQLSTNGILKIELRKINQVREEFIVLDYLYEKLAYFIINEEQFVGDKETNIFDTFEQEFGRTLSPMEYEIINGWLEAQFNEEIIIAALKEATYNGVSNLRYIDKILYEWKKKGINSINDIEKDKVKYQSKTVEKKELFDYDWLNDDE